MKKALSIFTLLTGCMILLTACDQTPTIPDDLKGIMEAAEQGNVEAQYYFGVVYRDGLGVTQDYKKSFEWFQKAAEQGDTGAQFNLGLMYGKGHGVTQDYQKAAEWYRKAAGQTESQVTALEAQ